MSIIKVENVGKKYTIGHKRHRAPVAGPPTFRDSMTHLFRGLYQRLRHPLSPNRETTEIEDFWALSDVSFEVERGDRVGIIGRNGAGKSTLLKVLSRITQPTTGRIEIDGRVASLLEVGTGFHPELSGRENIFLNGAVLGMTRTEIRERFDEIVEFAEIDRFLDTPVKRYSSGMYVRLAFAVAAHLEPEILIVDEVLAVGDAAFQRKCLGKMQDVSREGRTVLFVSHNMDAIGALCNRGILLESGSITADTTVRGAVSKYFEDFSATNSFRRTHPPSKTCYLEAASLVRGGKPTTALQNGDPLQLELELQAATPQRISFEIILRDQNYRPILFGPIGLARDLHHDLRGGPSRATLEYDLPFLASGDYYVDILLVDAGKKIFDNNESAIHFKIESTFIRETNWSFRQSRGQGSILLEGESKVVDDTSA
jgi:lipopolysaccharide transport system ATP-binding protein